MNESPQQSVLIEYRQMRVTGSAPHQVMEMMRNGLANMIALAVVNGNDPPDWALARWQAATDYLNSMTKRSDYWWRPTRPSPPRRPAHTWPWRNRSPRNGRRKIHP